MKLFCLHASLAMDVLSVLAMVEALMKQEFKTPIKDRSCKETVKRIATGQH